MLTLVPSFSLYNSLKTVSALFKSTALRRDWFSKIIREKISSELKSSKHMKFCFVLKRTTRADILQKGEKLSQEGSNTHPPANNLPRGSIKFNTVYLVQNRSSEWSALGNASHLEAQAKNLQNNVFLPHAPAAEAQLLSPEAELTAARGSRGEEALLSRIV